MTRKPLKPVAQEPERAVSPFGLLRPEEAADWLKISKRTLASLDIRRIKIGKSVRYDPIDLQQFADRHGDRHRVTESA